MLQPTALFPARNRAICFLLLLFSCPGILCAQSAKDIAKLRQAAVDLEKPTLPNFAAAEKKYRKQRINGGERSLYEAPASSNARDQSRLKAYIEYNFDILTNPKIGEPKKEGDDRTPRHIAIEEAARKLLGKLNGTGRTMNPGNARKNHQKKVFDAARDKAATLLDGNYYVRKEAIRILGGLGFRGRDKRLDIYAGSKDILLRVTKESPFQELRFHALTGLIRMVKAGKIPSKADQTEIMTRVATDLMKTKDPDAAYGLATLLADCPTTFTTTGKPEGIIALVRVLTDKNQSFIARAAAARAIGFTGEPTPAVEWPVLSWAIADFVAEAATEFNAQIGAGGPVANRVDAAAILDAYFSFQPYTQAAVDAKRGFRNRSADPKVEDAYKKVLPIAKAALGAAKSPGDKIPVAAIDALKAWVEQNRPKDRKYHGSAPPIPGVQQAEQQKGGQSGQAKGGAASNQTQGGL